MNYTGRPSISGCRPVLSLYPTHRFCQYLLLIFITFTNSFLFNRAFSTNSRRALSQRLPLWGQRRRPPPVAETGRSCWGRGQQDASGSEADAGSRNPALAGASPTERARLLTENHRRCDRIALTKSLPIAAPVALSCRACPLRHLR